MWTNAKKLMMVSRPISWVNTAYPFAAGYIMTGGSIDMRLIIGTAFFLIPYNLLMYGVNDVFDYESDIKNPRKGGVEGMREQRAFHPTILRWSLLLTVPFVLVLCALGTLPANLVLAFVIAMVIAYSAKGLRFKEVPVLDSITSSIHFVGPLVYALILTGGLATVWPYVVAMFAWGMASHAFGAVQDIIPDRKGHLASIATVLGARFTVWFSLLGYAFASVLVIAQGFPAYIVGITGLIYCVNVAPFLQITDETSNSANIGWKRFLWLNYISGAIVTIVLILSYIKA